MGEQRLYTVTVTYVGVVLASPDPETGEPSGNVLKWAGEICAMEEQREIVEPLGEIPSGWTPDDLVYHDGLGDVTLGEALAREPKAGRRW